MKVYRLTRSEYSYDLSGFGASISGGRWNYPGEFILYTAQTSSLSILEALVHLNGVTIGIRYNLLVIEVDDSGRVTRIKRETIYLSGLTLAQNTSSNTTLTNDASNLAIAMAVVFG